MRRSTSKIRRVTALAAVSLILGATGLLSPISTTRLSAAEVQATETDTTEAVDNSPAPEVATAAPSVTSRRSARTGSVPSLRRSANQQIAQVLSSVRAPAVRSSYPLILGIGF